MKSILNGIQIGYFLFTNEKNKSWKQIDLSISVRYNKIRYRVNEREAFMSFLNRFFSTNNSQENNHNITFIKEEVQSIEEIDESIFDSNELLEITSNGVLDTNSTLAIRKMQHNLKILVEKTKQEGKISQFMLIRDDDFFPYDWEWRVSSKATCLEKVALNLSLELKKQYALEKAGLVKYTLGMQLPVTEEETENALSQIDKELGNLYVPVHFRSTKHFTVNTPLGVTGKYNAVAQNRKFTIMDNINFFLSSKYSYSIAYHDAYLDVTHESLPISKEAIVLIEESKYPEVIKNPIISEQLKSRKVIVYRGDEFVAINMVLSEQGILPSQIGDNYFHYDDEVKVIIEQSIQDLAKTNHLLYDQSHGGKNGHFTDFFDGKNLDYSNSIEQFVQFLKSKFPNHSQIITTQTIQNAIFASQIVETIGTQDLLNAIEEYNLIMQKQLQNDLEAYKMDRRKITPEISELFQKTVERIQTYYSCNEKKCYSLEIQIQIEEAIQHFYQDHTVQEQLISANTIWNTLNQTINLDCQSNEILKDSNMIGQEEHRKQM